MLLLSILIWIILGLIALALLFSFWRLFWMFWPLFHGGAPHVPSSWDRISSMMRLAQIKPTDRIIELGSGDGRVAFAAAEEGAAEVVGYEINPQLVRRANREAKKRDLHRRVRFIQASYWNARLSRADVIFVFPVPYMMGRLEKKLESEMHQGARVISSGFRFPHWPIEAQDGEVCRYVHHERFGHGRRNVRPRP